MLTSVALGVAWRALPRAEETAVRVLLVRHGQSEANRDGLLSGGSDDSRLCAEHLNSLDTPGPSPPPPVTPPKAHCRLRHPD